MYSALVTYAVQVTLALLSNQTMYVYNVSVLCVWLDYPYIHNILHSGISGIICVYYIHNCH